MSEENAVSQLLGRIGRWFSPSADALAVGSPLPAITLPDENGTPVDLAAAAATGWTLVYFYPRADTPGCTKQACSLRDSYAALMDHGVRVFGVSLDKVGAQRKFRDKYQLPFPLLADTGAELATAFGVPHSFGFTRRQAFLFKDGVLVWRDLAAATEQQAEDVLRAVHGHGAGNP